MQTNLSRVGKIGASELSFVRDYREPLLEKGIINKEVSDRLKDMGNFCQTRYSTANRLQLDEAQLASYQEFILEQDRKKYNSAMIRGKACEQIMIEQWLNENEGWEVIDSQVRVERCLTDVNIPLIITADFIVQKGDKKKVIECKTKELNPSSNWSVNAWEKAKKDGCSFAHVLQVNQQMMMLGINEAEVITGAIIVRSEGKGKNKTFEYEISDNFTNKFTLDNMLVDAVSYSVMWLDHELKTNKEIFEKEQEEKTKADLQIDAFLEDFTATKEEIATDKLVNKILRLEHLKPFLVEAKQLEEEIKADIKQTIGVSRKLKLKADSFDIIANYTKPSFLDEQDVLEGIKKAETALEDAKKVEIGTAKSKPSLRWKMEKRETEKRGVKPVSDEEYESRYYEEENDTRDYGV